MGVPALSQALLNAPALAVESLALPQTLAVDRRRLADRAPDIKPPPWRLYTVSDLVANHCQIHDGTARVSARLPPARQATHQTMPRQGGRAISPCSMILWLSGGCSCLRWLECQGPDCTRTIDRLVLV